MSTFIESRGRGVPAHALDRLNNRNIISAETKSAIKSLENGTWKKEGTTIDFVAIFLEVRAFIMNTIK